MGIWDKIVEHAATERGVIWQAPAAVAACVFVISALIAFGIWYALDWRYSGIVASKDGTITNKDSMISFLQTKIDSLQKELAITANPTAATLPAHITELKSRQVPLQPSAPLFCGSDWRFQSIVASHQKFRKADGESDDHGTLINAFAQTLARTPWLAHAARLFSISHRNALGLRRTRLAICDSFSCYSS
jgi:hypothetical protein